MAIIGLPKSPSFMPVARQSPRAPAILRPWVERRERSAGMILAFAEDGRHASYNLPRHLKSMALAPAASLRKLRLDKYCRLEIKFSHRPPDSTQIFVEGYTACLWRLSEKDAK